MRSFIGRHVNAPENETTFKHVNALDGVGQDNTAN